MNKIEMRKYKRKWMQNKRAGLPTKRQRRYISSLGVKVGREYKRVLAKVLA